VNTIAIVTSSPPAHWWKLDVLDITKASEIALAVADC
jgi:hypothetical protein